MKKIPTMFERDWEGDRSLVLDNPNPECAWVFAGEGVATRKYDGMACMFDGATWFKRREIRDEDVAKKGLPPGFVEADRDDTTGKRVGWVPIGDGPEDKYLREAIEVTADNSECQVGRAPSIGTYEFLGPKSQGNVEREFTCNQMWAHAAAERYPDVSRTFDGIRAFLTDRDIEGIVFHHPDGRMAKIKKRDFGLKR